MPSLCPSNKHITLSKDRLRRNNGLNRILAIETRLVVDGTIIQRKWEETLFRATVICGNLVSFGGNRDWDRGNCFDIQKKIQHSRETYVCSTVK
jgi:hypothetical protein